MVTLSTLLLTHADLFPVQPFNRSSQIKRLRLVRCYDVSDEGLIEAIKKLPVLEELDLTLCEISGEPLKALGRSCPHLKSLKVNCQAYRSSLIDLDEEVEFNDQVIAIGENLPGLCHLQLIGNTMTNMGLEAILNGCPNLKSLDLRRCLNINLKGNLGKQCAEHIKCVWLPDDPLTDYGFVADPYNFPNEDNPFSFDDADFLFDGYSELENEFGYDFDYYHYSSGNESLDYDDFTLYYDD